MAELNLQNVIYEKQDRVAWVTINRPERMNAIDSTTNQELARVWKDYETDDDLLVAVLIGAGDRAFCAGADLRQSPGSGPPAGNEKRAGAGGGITGLNTQQPTSKPIIGAVHGYCLGAGFEMALACDILIASETAQFGIPEGRLGILGGAGPIHRLPRAVPVKVAMGMMLTGRRMNAKDALTHGLVSELAPDREGLVELAKTWAADVQTCSPLFTRALKYAVMTRLDTPMDVVLDTRFELIEQLVNSEDKIEGAAAYREGRTPQWKGR